MGNGATKVLPPPGIPKAFRHPQGKICEISFDCSVGRWSGRSLDSMTQETQ